MRKSVLAIMLSIVVVTGSVAVGAADQQSEGGGAKVAALQKRLAEDPKNRKVWVLLGNLHFDANHPKEAVVAYQKALDLNPDDPNVLCDQGIMYGNLGEPDKAMANFEKALSINPKHSQSLYNAGKISNEQLNQPSKALTYWKKLIEVDPSAKAAQVIKGYIDQLAADLEILKTGRPVSVEAKPAVEEK